MKYVILIGDGMADLPLDELGEETPLQVADKPNMDWIASSGKSGLLVNVPKGMKADSDVAIMSILGYDPRKYYTGRGPLEAAGMDVELGKNDFAFRCNLITEKDGLIFDYSGGHVSTDEAKELMEPVLEEYGDIGDFYIGVDYRHLFVLRDPEDDVERLVSTPPHKVIGERFEDNLIEPRGHKLAEVLNKIIIDSKGLLSGHPLNVERIKKGKNPANSIWLWGQGKKPAFDSVGEKYGISGAVISAVTLVKGLGALAGMDKIDVPGATGYYDTSYDNKADYGLKALDDHDLVIIHVEAPDEAGHAGDIERKVEAIENLDRLLGRILNGLDGDFKISIMADHPTLINERRHSPDPVPFALYSTENRKDNVDDFDEFSAAEGSMGTLEGHNFMDEFI